MMGREDISGNKQGVEQSRAVNDQVAELVDTLTTINTILRHDLFNDLTAIKGFLELFDMKNDRKYVNRARAALNKSIELICRMRELEYLATSGGNLRLVDAGQVAREVVNYYPAQPVDISVEGTCSVMADQALVSVIANIVQNAIIHGGAENITIALAERGGKCELRITDNGKGIPDGMKEKIFEPGFTCGAIGHTGLGLYIVKKTVTRYGGTVRMEDNQPSGSVFILELQKSSG
ncbi:MAG: sensor histidine kinase [Candidatus Odinarchaeota archaeon]